MPTLAVLCTDLANTTILYLKTIYLLLIQQLFQLCSGELKFECTDKLSQKFLLSLCLKI